MIHIGKRQPGIQSWIDITALGKVCLEAAQVFPREQNYGKINKIRIKAIIPTQEIVCLPHSYCLTFYDSLRLSFYHPYLFLPYSFVFTVSITSENVNVEFCVLSEMCEDVRPEFAKDVHRKVQSFNLFMFKNCFQNIGEGACSECRSHSKRLRVCSDCTTQSGLLSRDKDGCLRLSTETANELLETKILQIQSVAVCADCALDGKKHQGHQLVFATDIKNMKDVVQVLDVLSAVTLTSRKVEEEAKDCKQMAEMVTVCSSLAEILKYNEGLLMLADEYEDESSLAVGSVSLLKIVHNCLLGTKSLVKGVLLDEIKESKELMMKANSKKERDEWKKIVEKLENHRENCFSQDTSFDWKSTVLEAIKFYESGILNDPSAYSKVARELPRVTKDVRRTMKIPKEVEKYVNVAGSVLQLFMGSEENKEKELDLD